MARMVVEWTLGTLERFDWHEDRLLPRSPWPYEPLPLNYGSIPGYRNPADQAWVDALWTVPTAFAPGTWLEGEVQGMIWLADGDHKLLLGPQLLNFPQEGLWRFFAARSPRLTHSFEAQAFLQSCLL